MVMLSPLPELILNPFPEPLFPTDGGSDLLGFSYLAARLLRGRLGVEKAVPH
jgi:hypothetical protein